MQALHSVRRVAIMQLKYTFECYFTNDFSKHGLSISSKLRFSNLRFGPDIRVPDSTVISFAQSCEFNDCSTGIGIWDRSCCFVFQTECYTSWFNFCPS
mmetsp:Transcript_89332/g.238868  ORF Transcript_89332/g.238868 Transcript_89332/m.238868 type:complete len:98 (-) Transcript_89332:568-861(-)